MVCSINISNHIFRLLKIATILVLTFMYWSKSFGQTYQLNNGFTNGQTITTCGGNFFDSGGPSSGYSANENYTVTFCSSNGAPLIFTFSSFLVESWGNCNQDRLQVFNGPSTSSPLLGTYCGLNSPGTITSSGNCITFRFISNGSINLTGWQAAISCANCGQSACSNFVNLQFSNPTQIANPAGLVGDIWRFPSVMTGFDALVEITSTTAASSISTIDNPSGPTGAWSPEISLNMTAGTESFVDWRITIVTANTSTPANLPLSSRITSYDVDGNPSFFEIHRHLNPNGYILNNPTELVIIPQGQNQQVRGSSIEHTGISNDPEVKVTFYYPGQNNVFNIRLGVSSVTSSGNVTRQYAVSFDPCQSYPNPSVTPVSPIVQGTNNHCLGTGNVTYSTSAIFSTYNWSIVGGTIVSGQNTRTPVVNWTNTGNNILYITVTDGNGCVVSNSYPVSVNPVPTATITNNGPLCVGGALNITSNPSNGQTPYTFNWSGPASFSSSLQSPTRPSLLTTHSGTYSLTLTDANSCVFLGSTSVIVNAFPTLNISTSSTTICTNNSLTLTATPSGGAGTCTIQWQSSTNGTNWTNIAGQTGTTFTTPLLTSTVRYRAQYSCTGVGCCN
jgi:hypothetical protein